MTAAEMDTAKFLYGIHSGLSDDTYIRSSVVKLPIVKRTAKRIYYQRWEPVRRPDEPPKIGYVDRQAIEADTGEGVWARRTAGWWEPDNRLYREPPEVGPAPRPGLGEVVARLKAEMAEAHPDRGGTNAEFIAARRRYEAAKRRMTHTYAHGPAVTTPAGPGATNHPRSTR